MLIGKQKFKFVVHYSSLYIKLLNGTHAED